VSTNNVDGKRSKTLINNNNNNTSDGLLSSEQEKEHVFRVYDGIALHWHHTRGKRKVYIVFECCNRDRSNICRYRYTGIV
jgi:hypothetical protein